MKSQEFWVRSEEETESIAREISKTVSEGSSIALVGELGSGKTTFTRHLVKAFGISQAVSSPTYVLMNEYTRDGLTVEHWDLYRLSSLPEELQESPSKDKMRIVEWADKFPSLERECSITIRFELASDGRRRLCVERQ